MKNSMRDFRNSYASSLSAYIPGAQPQEKGWIKLNTNELPYSASPKALAVLREIAGEPDLLRRYSSPQGEPLLSALIQTFGRSPEDYLIANGSDEALSLIIRTVLSAGDFACMPEITYSLYPVLLSGIGAQVCTAPMQGELLTDLGQLEELSRGKAKLIFLPNPNAPTGEFISLEQLSSVIGGSEALWVVDEAYNDFVESKHRSALELLDKHDNLIVARTFSKSHGLAGLRVGYAASANKSLMQGLNALKDSYNLDAVAARVAAAALLDTEYSEKVRAEVIAQRNFLKEELLQSGWSSLPSSANFLFTDFQSVETAKKIMDKLFEEKILVRHFAKPVLEKYLRISIGSETENKKLLSVIKSIEAES